MLHRGSSSAARVPKPDAGTGFAAPWGRSTVTCRPRVGAGREQRGTAHGDHGHQDGHLRRSRHPSPARPHLTAAAGLATRPLVRAPVMFPLADRFGCTVSMRDSNVNRVLLIVKQRSDYVVVRVHARWPGYAAELSDVAAAGRTEGIGGASGRRQSKREVPRMDRGVGR